jgi:hypothetical protein
MNLENPFKYSTPDQIEDPQKAINLFVDVFKDFYLIESTGNTFINGPRGSGKSMMFRIMKPDCQRIRLGKDLNDLKYFAAYIPIKDKALDLEELNYIKGIHGEYILNEHLMTTYFAIAIFKCLAQQDYSNYDQSKIDVLNFYNNTFIKFIANAGVDEELLISIKEDSSINEVFNSIIKTLEEILVNFTFYIQKISLGGDKLGYSGALCLYRNFLYPIIKEISTFKFLPLNRPIYLLIDDADNLNYTQTRILNSWVSYRSTSLICYKISTQGNYSTYYTSSGNNKLDSPHDYHEINLMDIYTSNKGERYKENVKKIVEKRLILFGGIETSAEKFFPTNIKQEAEIAKIFKKQKVENGYDFAYRNARLDYMLTIPNQYANSYGGFEQLVHLSSGIIRNFIDLAFKMFDKAIRNKTAITTIIEIPISIQDEEIRSYADWFQEQLNKPIDDNELNPIIVNNFKYLKALVSSIGNAFRKFLISKTSERRKFSFYFDGDINKELKEVLRLGVSEGYFHYSKHGSKTGFGRSHKYVLNRILSPNYKLDPFAFSGYLYLTPEKLELAMKDERSFSRYINERTKDGPSEHESELIQLELDF